MTKPALKLLGKCSFNVDISSNPHYTTGYQIYPRVRFSSKDEREIGEFKVALEEMGINVISFPNRNRIYISIKRQKDLFQIIDIIKNEKIQVERHAAYDMFCKTLELIKEKKHKTPDGLAIVRQMKESL